MLQATNQIPTVIFANDGGKGILLLPIVSTNVIRSQFSGHNGGESCFAHIYSRRVTVIVKYDNMLCGCFFGEVIVAFTNILGRIVFADEGTKSWIRCFSQVLPEAMLMAFIFCQA